MPAKFTPISTEAMHHFLVQQGFERISAVTMQARELVYGKILKKNVCLRIYTSLVDDQVRAVGADAIRLAVVKRQPDGSIIGIGRAKRVHRVENWRVNLIERIRLLEKHFS